MGVSKMRRSLWITVFVLVGAVLAGPGIGAQTVVFEPVADAFEGELGILMDVRFPVTINLPGTLKVEANAEDSLKFHLYLYDVNGRTTLSSDTSGHESSREVKREGLAPGTYFVRLYRTQGQGSFVVQFRLAAATVIGDEEPNDTVDLAREVRLGEQTTGLLGYGNAEGIDRYDWYKVTTSQPGTLSVDAQAEDSLSVQLHLYDVNGRTTLSSDTAGHESSREVKREGLAPGTYFIRLYRSQGHGAYTLQTALTPAAFPGDEEPNDTVDLAREIRLGEQTTGLLGYGNAEGIDRYDWYKVTTRQPGTLSVGVRAENSLSVQLHLYDVNGRTTLSSDASGHESSRTTRRDGLAPGTYFIRLYRSQGHGAYTLQTALTPAAFPGDEEPNDTVDLARAIRLGEQTTGLLGYGNAEGIDRYDWFKVIIGQPGTLSVGVQAEDSLSVQLHLYDVNGRTTLASDTSGHESSRVVEREDLEPGTYFIRLYRSQGHGGYRILPQLISDDPAVDPVDASVSTLEAPTNGVLAAWQDVRAGDLCLRVPAGWYDHTESGRDRAAPGNTLLGYWASSPIVQGPGSHIVISLATEARLREDIAQNESDPEMVLVEQWQVYLAEELAEWYVYDIEQQGRIWVIHQQTPQSDGLFVAVVMVTEVETLPSEQAVLLEALHSMRPCVDP